MSIILCFFNNSLLVYYYVSVRLLISTISLCLCYNFFVVWLLMSFFILFITKLLLHLYLLINIMDTSFYISIICWFIILFTCGTTIFKHRSFWFSSSWGVSHILDWQLIWVWEGFYLKQNTHTHKLILPTCFRIYVRP